MSLFADANWPRASSWLAGEVLPEAQGRVAVIGAPSARGSITPGRCDLAPAAIRKALERFSTYDLDSGRDVRALHANDCGDVDVAELSPEELFTPVRTAVAEALEGAEAVILLGGDNSITRPGCHGLGDLESCGLLTLDAHLDLRDLDGGMTNGNPVRALLRDGLPGSHIVQIGVQSFANSQAYAKVAQEAGIRVISAETVWSRGIDRVVEEGLNELAGKAGRIYVDLDLDVLDRLHSPGTPGSRPGGLAPYQGRRAARLCGSHPKVRAIDLVEIDPTRDIADATVLAAASCLLEFSVGVLRRLDNNG
jgi:formiminoglutamase